MVAIRRFLAAALATLSAATAATADDAVRFNGFASTVDEVEVGTGERPAILEQFGGEIAAPAFRRYVAQLGETLASGVGRAGLKLTFTVLDSPVVASFATPGGFVYITRGLAQLADSEAEIAAVLAHEIGHEVAQHYPRRDRRTVLANLELAGLGGGGRPALGRVLAAGAMPVFTREEELDADTLALRLLVRGGQDPDALPRMLTKLRAAARLSAALAGEDADGVDPFGWLAAHPVWDERIARVREFAERGDAAARAPSRDAYLDQIDGLPFGAAPGHGMVDGRVYLDAAIGVRFEAPVGFRLFALPHGAAGFGPHGARLLFDVSRDDANVSAVRHLRDTLAKDEETTPASTIEVNGFEAATASARGLTDAGEADVRLVVIRGDGGTFYRFAFATPPEHTAQLARALRRATYSFRRLSEKEAHANRSMILRIVSVAPGDTVDSLAAHLPFPDRRRERFEVLNGLAPGATVAPGLRVKTVTAAPAREPGSPAPAR